jgi:hypothetical protein
MRGSSAEQWRPEDYLRERHPEIRVVDADLPGRLQGFISHDEGIIWLRNDLSEVERRSTLAYEIAQLKQGPTPGDACLAAAHQRDAAEWAARMLIDTERFVEAFSRSASYADVAALLGVDVPTVRARLRGLTDVEQDAVFAAILDTRLSA